MEESDELLALIGQRVTQRRASLGLTLDQVAALSDVSRAMVSRIERGEVHASAVVLDRLCAGLGITLSELFARETPTPLLRRAEQPVWRDPSSLYLRREVGPARSGSPVQIVEIEFPPGAEVTFAPYPDRISDSMSWCSKASSRSLRQAPSIRSWWAIACTCGSPTATASATAVRNQRAISLSSSGSRRRDATPHPRLDFRRGTRSAL